MGNYLGKSPLRMHCPLCQADNEHKVIQPEPATYHWSSLNRIFLLESRNFLYRRRLKQCTDRGKKFARLKFLPIFFEACPTILKS